MDLEIKKPINEFVFQKLKKKSFFQFLTLLSLSGNKKVVTEPNLTLEFSASEIHSVEKDKDSYKVLVNFFGLYGIHSPLPTFYTEEIIQQLRDDVESNKKFLDIVHHVLYDLLYQSWKKGHRQLLDTSDLNTQISSYLSSTHITQPKTLVEKIRLFSAGLFFPKVRTTTGLKHLLKSVFSQDADIEILENVPKKIVINGTLRSQLGLRNHSLGKSILLGSSYWSQEQFIIIKINIKNPAIIKKIIPKSSFKQELFDLIRSYLPPDILFQLSITAPPHPLRLLGYNTLLGASYAK